MNAMIRGVVVAATLAFLAGCTSYIGLQPVQPLHGDTVTDLHPTFSWHAAEGTNVTYDLVVHEVEGRGEEATGKQVYYREGLAGTQHRMETALAPGKRYTWSVRARRGSEVDAWLVREYTLRTIIYDRTEKGPLLLKTQK